MLADEDQVPACGELEKGMYIMFLLMVNSSFLQSTDGLNIKPQNASLHTLTVAYAP